SRRRPSRRRVGVRVLAARAHQPDSYVAQSLTGLDREWWRRTIEKTHEQSNTESPCAVEEKRSNKNCRLPSACERQSFHGKHDEQCDGTRPQGAEYQRP